MTRQQHQGAVLTAATLNLHAGEATPSVPGFMRRHNAHLGSLQEVRNLDRLERELEDAHPGRWGLYPDEIIGTALVHDKRRLRFLEGGNPLITEGVGEGAPRLGWTPERRLTWARYRDRVTGRIVVGFSMHTWAVGDAEWKRGPHVDQVTAFANDVAGRGEAAVVIVGMDGNEDLVNQRGPDSIRRQFGAVHLEPSFVLAGVTPKPTQLRGRLVLDGVFWRDDDHVSRTTHARRRIGAGADHYGAVSTSYIAPR